MPTSLIGEFIYYYTNHEASPDSNSTGNTTRLQDKIWHNETYLTVAAMILHTPLFWVSASFSWAVLAYATVYLFLHRKTHEHVEFFKKWCPWHYEHHMGKNQNANWCVVCPLMDHIMGTREKWLDKS